MSAAEERHGIEFLVRAAGHAPGADAAEVGRVLDLGQLAITVSIEHREERTRLVGELLASADGEGKGGFEFLNFGGETFVDDSAWYEAVVTAVDEQSCEAPYMLQVVVGSW